MGSSSLYHLTHSSNTLPRGSSITLIESSSTLAPGASGKSGGFLAEDWHGVATESIASLSFRLHRELAEQDGGKDKWGYRDVETVSLQYDSSKNSPKDKGPNWIDQRHVVKTSVMGGGGTTAQVTPEPLVRHLVQQAQARANEGDITLNVKLSTHAQKAQIDSSSNRITSLEVLDRNSNETSTIECTDLVLATGPWTGQATRKLFPRQVISSTPCLNAASNVSGSRAHSVVIHSALPTSEHCLFTEIAFGPGGRKAAAPEVYARADGTVYVCGGSDDVPLPEYAEDIEPDLKQTAKLLEQSAVLAPQALDVNKTSAKCTREQCCYLPIARGNMILDGDEKMGVYVAGCGASCWGITMGLGVGKCLSELVLDGKVSSADVSMLKG
ncbi:unnamed protein product [Sympodiomycopsis kandeliae]